MARYTGPKRRLSRREGIALFAKDNKVIERKGAVAPGPKGSRLRRRLSEYGVQLREKQKCKRMFGLTEKQFAKLYREAASKGSGAGERFLQMLESRLDNVVYRLGLASSRQEARQMVTHGHVSVDGKKVSVPSLNVKINSVVAISANFVDNTQVQKNLSQDQTLPEWLERKATVGKVLRVPTRDEMEQSVNERLIVEFYSR